MNRIGTYECLLQTFEQIVAGLCRLFDVADEPGLVRCGVDTASFARLRGCRAQSKERDVALLDTGVARDWTRTLPIGLADTIANRLARVLAEVGWSHS